MKHKAFKTGNSYYCGKEIFKVTARYVNLDGPGAYIVLDDSIFAELYMDKNWNQEAKFLRGDKEAVIKAVDEVGSKE